jgi:hypothetical protein
MLRAICKTADFDELYDTQAWSCGVRKVIRNLSGRRRIGTGKR